MRPCSAYRNDWNAGHCHRTTPTIPIPHEGLNIHAETAATWEAVHPVHSRYILGQYGNRSARSHRLPSPAPAEKHQFREFRLLSVQCQPAALLNISESLECYGDPLEIGRASCRDRVCKYVYST